MLSHSLGVNTKVSKKNSMVTETTILALNPIYFFRAP